MIYYSSCCGEEIKYPNSDIDICPDCKEWCDVVGLEDDEESVSVSKDFNVLSKILSVVIVLILLSCLIISLTLA